MTAPQRVSYRMESTLESVNKAEAMAEQISSQAGFDEDTRGGISMAVREAMINAVLHGNAYDPGKSVNLTFEQNGRELTSRSPTRERDSIRSRFPTRWPRKIL